ncbi:hypothetical protein OHM08_002565 [Enterococcus faecium]|nr:hypothetical protein [Enterococcus faecium]
MARKSQYELGLDAGFISCANAALHFMASENKYAVAELARTLGVTHSEMVDVEGSEDIEFEEYIPKNDKNENYWS